MHLWRYLPILIILGLATYLLLPEITTLEHSWAVVQRLSLWAVIVAVIAETISWLGNGLVLYAILRINHQKLPVWKGALIAVATLSISLVAGGAVGLAAMIGWIHRENGDGNTAFLASTLPAFLNTGVLVGVSLIGTIYLLFVRVLTKAQLIEFSIVLLLLGTLTAIVMIALSSLNLAIGIAVWLERHWASLMRKPSDPEKITAMVQQFFMALKSLGNGKWLYPLVGAIVNVGFDMLALFFLFIAAGRTISAGSLFAGYGLPLVLGKMAFVFPGGVGVVEGSMVALFDKLHVLNTTSAVVILGYRLFSFWLPTLLGFAAAAYLSGKLFSLKKKKG